MVAELQGQTAALNMMGRRVKFDAVPFFWSQHYDVRINYVGHAEHWDEITVDGDIKAKDCLLNLHAGLCLGRRVQEAKLARSMGHWHESIR